MSGFEVSPWGMVLPCDEHESAILRTSLTFQLDWPAEFEAVSDEPLLPVISTSLLMLSFSLEVSPVSCRMRPSSARSVKLPC